MGFNNCRVKEKIHFVSPDIVTYNSAPTLEDREFNILIKMIYDMAGITLDQNKMLMVESRLSKQLRLHKLSSYCDYIKLIKQNPDELLKFVNALTTNKTDFFREPYHFEFLVKTVLPVLLKRTDNLKFWSAAASSGEEIYTLAMVLSEFFHNDLSVYYKILGSDIDTNILDKAKLAIYRRKDIVDIRPDLVAKYFLRGCGDNKGLYKVGDHLRSFVKFRYFNLIQDEFPFEMKFDVIFLRNVLIYFDSETIQKVVNKMHRMLNNGGYFFVGHSESLNSIKHGFKNLGRSVYQKIKNSD